MKDTWRNLPLSEVVSMRPGNNKIIKGKQSNRPGPGLSQAFSASGPDVWVSSAEYNQPGVVISAVGARCGKTFIAQGRWSAIANTHVLLPGEDVDPRWLWYRTNDEAFWIRGGTAQPFVKVRETLQRPCMIPPLAEQQRIVRLLDEAFEGIAIAKANAEKNLQNARALFESCLRAAFAQGRLEHDGGEGGRGGAMGKYWPTYSLGELVELVMGQAPSSKDTNFLQQGTPFVKVGEFGTSRPVFREWTTKPLRMARSTDVLLCVVGATCGKINLGADCAIGRSVAAIRADTERLDQFYLYYFMMTLVEQLRSGSQGAAQTVISRNMVERVQIPVPSLSEQQQIVRALDELVGVSDLLASAYAKKLAALDDLQKSLLNQAFRGELEAA